MPALPSGHAAPSGADPVRTRPAHTRRPPATQLAADRARPASREEAAERALAVLLDAALDPIVDMVLLARDGAYEAHSHDGSVRFRRTGPGPDGYERASRSTGADPLADRLHRPVHAPRRRARPPAPAPQRERLPVRATTTIAQLFDHPAAPDLCVLHSAAHNWEDQGGHLGEHGSLGIVQARAPFVLAGKGVRPDGLVRAVGPSRRRRADRRSRSWAARPTPPARYLAGQDGDVLADVLDVAAGRPRHVVVFLFDGTNANVLYDMARRGEAPNVARLVDDGHRATSRRDGGPARPSRWPTTPRC